MARKKTKTEEPVPKIIIPDEVPKFEPGPVIAHDVSTGVVIKKPIMEAPEPELPVQTQSLEKYRYIMGHRGIPTQKDERAIGDWVLITEKAKRRGTWHVIACGPSAAYILERGVPRENSIAINGSIMACIPSCWLALDPMPAEVISDVEGKVLSEGMTCLVPWQRSSDEGYVLSVPRVIFGHQIGPEPEKLAVLEKTSLLWWHYSSTHAAIEVARACGAEDIILWGVDYGKDPGHAIITGGTDYQSGYRASEDKVFGAWQALAGAYRSFHVKLWNASPDSRLRCIEKIDPEAAIRGRVPRAFVGN